MLVMGTLITCWVVADMWFVVYDNYQRGEFGLIELIVGEVFLTAFFGTIGLGMIVGGTIGTWHSYETDSK